MQGVTSRGTNRKASDTHLYWMGGNKKLVLKGGLKKRANPMGGANEKAKTINRKGRKGGGSSPGSEMKSAFHNIKQQKTSHREKGRKRRSSK